MKSKCCFGHPFLITLILALANLSSGQDAPKKPDPLLSEDNLLAAMHSISTMTLFHYAKELGSDRYEGRWTGTPGYHRSALWAADLFKQWNIKAAGDKGSYLQNFVHPYTIVMPGSACSLQISLDGGGTITKSYVLESDYCPSPASDSGDITAEVIYVGYGITAPEMNYDEYGGLDVKGKIVLVEPQAPVSADREAEEFKRWRPYSSYDAKLKNAKDHGAAGLMIGHAGGDFTGAFVKDLVVTNVSPGVVDDIFAGAGKKRDSLLETIRAKRQPVSFATGKTVTLKNLAEHHPEGIGANVIGILEGKDPALKAEVIIIGGHLDGSGGNPSLRLGAGKDASGAAVTLGVAEALGKSGMPLKRPVIFVLFGAGEQGAKGSEYFLAHPPIPNARARGFIHLQNVGQGDRIHGGAGANYPQLWEFFERNNRKYIHRPIKAGFSATLERSRKDAAHFIGADMPVISFETPGSTNPSNDAYPVSRDPTGVLTPDIMTDLARLVFLAVVEMANK
jgi:hypothetical protein